MNYTFYDSLSKFSCVKAWSNLYIFMSTRLGVLVLGCDHTSRMVKINAFFCENLLPTALHRSYKLEYSYDELGMVYQNCCIFIFIMPCINLYHIYCYYICCYAASLFHNAAVVQWVRAFAL